MGFNLYGTIIILAIAAGIFSADALGYGCGITKRTLFYTSFFNLICILMFAFFYVFVSSGGTAFGISGLGGIAGLMTGTVFSVYIHGDHPTELLTSWVISAPLMYSVSKLACLNAGCCSGNLFGIPVQIVESVSFMVIYLISLLVFIKGKRKIFAAYIAMGLSFTARFGLDYFRDSHSGHIISAEQIIILIAGIAALCLIALRKRLPLPGGLKK